MVTHTSSIALPLEIIRAGILFRSNNKGNVIVLYFAH